MDFDEKIENFRFYFNYVIPIFFVVTGLIGNATILFVFLSKKLRDISMNRYLVAQAISDSIVVILLVPHIMPQLYERTRLSCKTLWYVIGCFYTFSTHMCTLAAIDRYFSVIYSLRFAFKNTLKFQLSILAVVLVFAIANTLPYSLYFDAFSDEKNQTVCAPTSASVIFYSDSASCFINALIPFLIMLFCTIAVYRKLIHLKVRLHKTEAKKETCLLKTLIGMNVFFFVINAPVNVALIYLGYMNLSGIPSQMTLLVYDLTGALSTVHNAFSIVVYLISNKTFLGQFLSIFCREKLSQKYTSS